MWWSEIAAFILGATLILTMEYFKGFARERGKAHGRSIRTKSEVDQEKIYRYLLETQEQLSTTEDILNNVFNNKRDIGHVYVLLKNLKKEEKILHVEFDQATKETTCWRVKV
jgi:hypothetical protein